MTLLRILITNDDGVGSPGLGLLTACLAADGHDVFVVAPAVASSGSAAAVGDIVDGAEVVTRSVVLTDAPSVPAFAVDGPPGRCVLVAVGGAFGPPPDLVLSGINPGANVGGANKRLTLSGSAHGTLTISWVDRPSNGAPVENDASLVKAGYATLTRVVTPAATEPEPFPDLFRT
jgi:5'-nucleotidase